MIINVICRVASPVEILNNKWYLYIEIDDDTLTRVMQLHTRDAKPVKHLVDPLQGNRLKVKVPFRYNRVMCRVTGNKTIHELCTFDVCNVTLNYCGWWVSDCYGGPAWKLVSLDSM